MTLFRRSFLPLSIVLLTTLAGCQVPTQSLRQDALAAMSKNDLETANKYLTQAEKQSPYDWRTHYYLGVLRLKQDKPIEAQTHLETALTLHPDEVETPHIYDALAEALFEQHDYPAMSAFLTRCAQEHHTAEDYLRQAKYLRKAGDMDGSTVAFRKAAVFAKPDERFSIYMKEADFFHEISDRDREVIALRHAYTVAPESPVVAERMRALNYVPGPTAMLPLDQQND